MSQIVGQVDSAGQATIGSELFSAGRPSTGNYTVTYDTSFSTDPVVVATALNDGDSTAEAIDVGNSDKSGFSVTIKSTGGNLKNKDFNFIATEPAS